MRRLLFAAILVAVTPSALVAPAAAQSYSPQARWDQAQARYQRETSIYQAEQQRYQAWRRDRGYRDNGRYQDGRYPDARYDDRDERGYDASRDYRDGPNYQERQLAADDRVYRGSDGRYYCKRNDGTTGLIVGAAAGGILGNVIDGGHSRTAGTLIGGALGALTGKSIDQNSNKDIRCR